MELIQQFKKIIGDQYVLTGDDMTPFLCEWRDRYRGRAAMVLCPENTQEVAQIMVLASQEGVKIVPQGGNTGLVGGQIPFDAENEAVISLSRLNKVGKIDPDGNVLHVEAGVTLEEVQNRALEVDRLFPLSLASQGSCQIGGNLASNAGGVNVLAYGNMRDLCLGLEVVLADGRIWNGLRALKKDNTGYDLRDLFIGSEGTLGIITAAVLKIFPNPRERATAYVGLNSLEQIAALYTLAMEKAGGQLTAFEIMPRRGLEFVLRHMSGARDPLAAPHEWYALLEISSLTGGGAGDKAMADLLEQGFERGIVEDAALPSSLEQRAAIWALRERMSGAQKPEGGSIKHDISVPINSIPSFIEEANAAVGELVTGCRPVPFGHFGDGNIHYNISQPKGMDKQDFLDRWEEVSKLVHGLVMQFNGSISAEHGIGHMKREMLQEAKDPVELDLMRSIKQAIDPKGILNPGKLL
ncbi:MAG: FAD-binding oxidoreductase [Hyphomicrobiaceae bacterium]|nr:FAD-binding oxidoreductase [Hyphomicrobiaceae bacterium]